MVDQYSEQTLSRLLKAMSDGTRRALMTQLCQNGPCRVTDLANSHDMSLNAISKHIKVLEEAGLVRRKTIGRTHWIDAQLAQLALIEHWCNELQSVWQLRVDKLAQLIEMDTDNE